MIFNFFFFFFFCGVAFPLPKGAFINTLVGGGGWAKWRGDQKSFELPEGGDQKVFLSKGGVKKVRSN